MSEDRIFKTIARVYISLDYIEQNAIITYIDKKYYEIAYKKINFLVKLYKIYYRKTYSKFKGSLKNIVFTRLFKRV